MNIDYQISKKIQNVPEALSIYINQIVYSEKRKGIDIATLSLGEAFFDIPEFSFKNIDFVKGYHYSDSLGLPELRKKIMNYYNSKYDAQIKDIDEILISSGSKAIIFMAMQAVLNDGDEVLIHEPAWLSYEEQVKLVGASPRFLSYDCKVEEFPSFFTEKTKLLILNNPNNPAGWIYDSKKLQFIYEECKRRGIYILMDEAYSDFVGTKDEFISLASIVPDKKGVIIVNSLSKNMGMSGWRIGYVIAEKGIINNILKLNQHIITCAPTILQMYLAYYFDDIISITLPQAKEVVEKRKRIKSYMNQIGLDYLPGNSTFYFLVSIEGNNSSTLDFCLYLLFKYGIATVPGGAYGKSTEKFVRVGIGAESEERLKLALNTIKTVIKQNSVDAGYVDKKLKDNGFYKFEEK